MKRTILILSAFLGSLFVAPVLAQQVVRIYGTTSGGIFLPALVDTSGRLLVDLAGGSVTPDAIQVAESTCAAPGLAGQTATTTGLAITVTPSLLLCVGGNPIGTLTGTTITLDGIGEFGPNGELDVTAVAVTSAVPYLAPESATVPGFAGSSLTTWGFGVIPGSGPALFTASSPRLLANGSNQIVIDGTYALTWGSSGLSSPDISLSRLAADVVAVAAGDAYGLDSKALIRTDPSIASGFGTTPSVVVANGTAAFTVDVGTGGTASSGVLTMPTATTGWACQVENVTAVAANRADQRTVQTATSTTSVTVQNQTVSTGGALAWTASDVLRLLCLAY